MADRGPEAHSPADALEEFAGGEIHARHGTVNWWLRVLYAGLAIWGIHYVVKYWGGLGPGLAVGQ
jgi:hypothetical protein